MILKKVQYRKNLLFKSEGKVVENCYRESAPKNSAVYLN